MTAVKINDIVQVNPEVEVFGGCMVVVTEVKSWGVQGYVQSAGIEGLQFVRLSHEKFEPTGGVSVWVAP